MIVFQPNVEIGNAVADKVSVNLIAFLHQQRVNDGFIAEVLLDANFAAPVAAGNKAASIQRDDLIVQIDVVDASQFMPSQNEDHVQELVFVTR